MRTSYHVNLCEILSSSSSFVSWKKTPPHRRPGATSLSSRQFAQSKGLADGWRGPRCGTCFRDVDRLHQLNMSLLYTAGTRSWSVLLLDARAGNLRVYASLTGLHVINRRRLNVYAATQKPHPPLFYICKYSHGYTARC